MNNDHHIAVMPWSDYGFGIYLDVINLKASFSIENTLGFAIVLLIIFSILYSKTFKELYKMVKFEKMYSTDKEFGEYAILSISFWYVITFLYSNVDYRLLHLWSIFTFVYNKWKQVKGLIIGLMFLEPVIWHSEVFVRNIFLTINNVCHYIIFLICAKFLFTYSMTQIKKLLSDISNNKLIYQDMQGGKN